MELRRFYVDQGSIREGIAEVRGEEYRHMTGVLRFRVGFRLILCDGSGNDYYCTVTAVDKDKAVCQVDEIRPNESELSYDLTLAMSRIKQEKLEIAVQKAVEIGVKRIILFASRYTAEPKVRQDRIERIVKEACKQCGRAVLPQVTLADNLDGMIDKAEGKLLVAYEKADLHSRLSALIGKEEGYTVVIGPEGGFAREEIEQLAARHAETFSLGARILRAETAAIVSLGDVVCIRGE